MTTDLRTKTPKLMTSNDEELYKDNRFLVAILMLGALLSFLLSSYQGI